jgi:hypothetical protein
MGMPCEVNSILKLNPHQGYPVELVPRSQHQAVKSGYRILPMDVPLPLVDEQWLAHADIVIRQLTWENGKTQLTFEIHRVYASPFSMKD